MARTHAILGGVRYGEGDLTRAGEEFERGVEAVERLRDNQPDELAAARFLWDWAFLYYRSVGALHRREALLTFQMSTRETDERKWYWNGGSWGIVVTRNDARAYRLPDSDVLSQRISAFLGDVDRLIVVPAGGMHHLALAVLGPANGPPLGARFSLARVPSASWWVERRRDAPSPGPLPGRAVAIGAGVGVLVLVFLILLRRLR